MSSSTALDPRPSAKPVINYEVTDEQIAATKAKYLSLEATTPQGYETVKHALSEVKRFRIDVEKRRKELKEDSLAWGRMVDAEAKRITNLILEIESPLQAKKDQADAEKERLKREKEEALRKEQELLLIQLRAKQEAEAKAAREAEEARLKEQTEKLRIEREALEAERQRLAELQRIENEKQQAAAKAEQERLAVERAKLEADRKAAEAESRRIAEELRQRQLAEEARQRAEREKLEKERAELKAAKEKAEREEFERQAKIKAEEEAKAKAERDRIAAEEARVREIERQAELAKRIEAMKPDVEKVHDFAKQIRAITIPALQTTEATDYLNRAVGKLSSVIEYLEEFKAQ